MKKIAKIMFFLSMVIILLSSCEKQPETEVSPEVPENIQKTEIEFFSEAEGIKFYTESVVNGTRPELYYEANVPKTKNVIKTEQYITDSDGTRLIDHPFDFCVLVEPNGRLAHEDYYTLIGSLNGDHYRYIFEDGKFSGWIYEPAGETDEENFGYKIIRYCFGICETRYGIINPEGETIAEALYPRIEVSFENRFVLYEGGEGMFTSAGEGRCLLTDEKCNVLSMYTYISYIFLDDGSYIGIANVAGGDSVPCYDETGKKLDPGYYFIDKNGRQLSERFENVSGNVYITSDPEEILSVVDAEGNAFEFKAGKYALMPGDEFLDVIDGTGIYRKAFETGKTIPAIEYGRDGTLNSITEVPEVEYRITDIEGNLLIEHPFHDLVFFGEIESDDLSRQRYVSVGGCYKGDWYSYRFADGKFELEEIEKAGEFELNGHKYQNNYKNYIPTRYSFGYYSPYFGLNDREGNVIFEPIFTYVPSIPFNDRIIVTTNNVDRMDGWEGFSVMMDFDRNVISTFSDFYFYHFDDGSYIGIAWYAGYGEKWGHVLKDESGNILETGHRFIDKDGNVLSSCFDLFSLCGNEDDFIAEYLDKTAFFKDEDGNEIKITPKDYICKP